MTLLSVRAKEAIKTGLAMTIAFGLALGMGWDKPSWAGFAVAMISLSTAGQSLNKGLLRMLGTVVAAAVALILIAMFAQERWLFMVALSVYLGFCTYMLTGKKFQYFWYVSAFVCLIIAVGAGPTAESAFQTAILRTQQTGMGILVYSLVSVFLWPQRSGGALKAVAGGVLEAQHRVFQAYSAALVGTVAQHDGRALRMQQVQVLNQFRVTLAGAEADTRDVWEARRRWSTFDEQATKLGEAMERWRASFPEIDALGIQTLMPNLPSVLVELDRRFEQTAGMLAGAPLTSPGRALKLELDGPTLQSLNHLQRAAAASFKAELEAVERLSRALLDCVADIADLKPKGHEQTAEAPAVSRARTLELDPDRLLAVFQVATTLWITFLIWVYLNPPGHAAFVQLAASVAMAAAMMPQARVISMVLPFALGSLLAGVVYVFVMPHLSGYAELGILIFAFTFAIYYFFGEPRQALAKLGCIVPFLVFTSIQNEQSYDFAVFLNSVAMLLLGLFLIVAVSYLPPSPRPEKVFLRLLKRFFRHADFMLSRLTPDAKKEMALGGRLETALYRNDLLELPDKLAMYGRQIDHKISPENTPERIQAIVNVARILADRIKMLEDATQYPQSDMLVQELRDDVRAWRSAVQVQCRLWAHDPENAASRAEDLKARLSARLDRLEARISQVFDLPGAVELEAEDYENFYRLLGSYRGVSEGGIEYARQAARIHWAHWREGRF